MSERKYLEEFIFSDEVMAYKQAFVKKNNITPDHRIMTDSQFRYKYITETANPKIIAALYEHLMTFNDIQCSKESVLDIAKYIVEKCVRSQDVLELSEAPAEIFLKAAKEFDRGAVEQIIRFMKMKDVYRPVGKQGFKEKLMTQQEQKLKRVDIATKNNSI